MSDGREKNGATCIQTEVKTGQVGCGGDADGGLGGGNDKGEGGDGQIRERDGERLSQWENNVVKST